MPQNVRRLSVCLSVFSLSLSLSQEDEEFDTPQQESKKEEPKADTTSRRALRFVKTMLKKGGRKTKKDGEHGASGGSGSGRQRSMSDADAFDSALKVAPSTVRVVCGGRE